MSKKTNQPTQPNQSNQPTQPKSPTIEKHSLHPAITPKAYSQLKRYVIRTEYDNYDSLYIVPCAGDQGWHEIGDHSALIYYYDIVKDRLKKPKFAYDSFSGFYGHYEFGRIAVRSIEDLTHTLDSTNIKYKLTTLDAHGRHTTNPIHITRIRLATTYPDDTIDKFVKLETTRRETALRVPRADILTPELYLNLTDFALILQHLINRNFNSLARSALAHTLLEQTNHIVRTYYEIAHLASLLEGFQHHPEKTRLVIKKILTKHLTIRDELDHLHITIQMAYSYHYIDVENCCIIEDRLAYVRKQIIKSFQTITKTISSKTKKEAK